MRIRLLGTAGPAGWPAPGCRCASCGRAAAEPRGPARVRVDDRFTLVAPQGPAPQLPDGYRATVGPAGTLVRGPDGGTLLHASAAALDPHNLDPAPADAAVVDVTAPSALGALRRAGAVTDRTVLVGLGGDHRLVSPRELRRRCTLWGVRAAADGEEMEVGPDPAVHGADGGAPVSWPRRCLVLGGARSGKSAEAELRLLAAPEVTYVATGPPTGEDPEWDARVAAHARRRPGWWRTLETLDVASALRGCGGAVLVDGLGIWLARTMDVCGVWGEGAGAACWDALEERVGALVAAWRECAAAAVVAVGDEAGSGIVPASASGRLFRDQLGLLNQRLAAESEEAVLTVAGRPMELG